MATAIWRGTAAAVQQVNTVTPANVEVGDIFTIRLEDRMGENYAISFTATAATVQNVVEGLKAAADAAKAAGKAPWDAVSCTEDDAKLTITALTAGEPFWVTTSTTDGGGTDDQTLTDANVTPCAGPHIWNTPENWDIGTVPGASDVWILPAGNSVGIYGFDATATPTSNGYIEAGYAGAIGSRARPLKLSLEPGGHRDLTIASTEGQKFIDVTNYGTIRIDGAPGSPGSGQYGLYLTGSHDTTMAGTGEIIINSSNSGSVGLAAYTGDTLEVNQIYIKAGYVTIGECPDPDGDNGAIVIISGGTVTLADTFAQTTGDQGYLRIYGGSVTARASGLADIYVHAGATLYWQRGDQSASSSLSIIGAGTVDCSRSQEPKTCITLKFEGDGGQFLDPNGSVTFSNPIELHNTDLSKITLSRPVDKKYTEASI